jgi:hypothetical protein
MIVRVLYGNAFSCPGQGKIIHDSGQGVWALE